MHTTPRPVACGLQAAFVSLSLLLAACGDGMAVPVAAAAGAPRAPTGAADLVPTPRYDRDVRPLLSDRCFRCHGPDDKKRAADRRLDTAEGARRERKGRVAIAPGDLQRSELWRRIESTDPDLVMPPPDSGKKPLSPAERQLLRQWIEQGAEYEPHWSFVPPQRPEPPPATAASGDNPVDRFVGSALARQGLQLSPPADADTVCRRLFLALTGLPPQPQELDGFAADTAPDAAARLVHRLLHEEPYRSRFAEHIATPWLDAARYADTSGIHMDAGRQIWPWRDWVLEAYRSGMPFDRFVTEQIAGDLLPGATAAQKVASGFHRNHVTTDEGGAIDAEYLVEYAADRTATTGQVLLGLTLQCARCHEHKYDPVSQDEYYSLFAFFNSIEEPGLYSQVPDDQRALEPFLVVPTEAQQRRQQELQQQVADAKAAMQQEDPAEQGQRQAFLHDLAARGGVEWPACTVTAASSRGGATLGVEADGSVLASGANPDQDDHVITLRTDGSDLRLLALQALTDARLPLGRVGRSPNGNAVLTAVRAEAVSVRDPQQRRPVTFGWAWADHEQLDGEYRADFVLADDDRRGWAVGAHQQPGGRTLLLLADAPFGFDGGTDVQVTLRYRSVYAQHVLGRVRLSLGRMSATGLDLLPTTQSGFYVHGAHPAATPAQAYDQDSGVETLTALPHGDDPAAKAFRFDANLRDATVQPLADGVSATYVARELYAPSPRRLELSLGSDDGFRLFVNGKPAGERRVDRAVAADQDKVQIDLPAGRSLVVLKVVNTGGAGGCYWRLLPRDGELAGDLPLALLPANGDAEVQARVHRAWRTRFSQGFRAQQTALATAEQQLAELERALPRTMVMQERDKPRDTFVLMRGAYDKPDPKRKVERAIPAALGKLPAGAPANRLGLAQWLMAPENPLVARVAVNRLWEFLFGTGIVRTSEDFGMQGEWPSHPELLDWLAVEYRASGWDPRHMLELIATSRTFLQSSRSVPAARERDPDNRLLAFWPRRRLTAEAIRDQALYTAGFLVEQFGGPSVKPYQPEGLWQEVAMVQSNTRVYRRGSGDDLFRRSLYTYWKRACPPPSLLTFDAPTREFCTIRRIPTNTPLQALVLWNDEQHVEAARGLAARALAAGTDDTARLAFLLRTATAHAAPTTIARLQTALTGFRSRYQAAEADAKALLAVGTRPLPAGVDPRELAAWTLLASATLNLDATLCTE